MANFEMLVLVNLPLIFTLGFMLQSLLPKSKWIKVYIFGITLTGSLFLLTVIEKRPFGFELLGFAILYAIVGVAAAGLYTILKKILRIYYLSRYK